MLLELSNVLNAKGYAPRSIRNYVQEMRLLFAYYNNQNPKDLVHKDLVAYLNFIKNEHGVGRDKCRLFAASASFFYKNILRTELVFAHELYPRKEFKLPEILSQEQIIHLLNCVQNPKHKLMTLARSEFLRRFELHILPKRFTKIRHYGFLQNYGKRKRLEQIRASLQLSPLLELIKIPTAIRRFKNTQETFLSVRVVPTDA